MSSFAKFKVENKAEVKDQKPQTPCLLTRKSKKSNLKPNPSF